MGETLLVGIKNYMETNTECHLIFWDKNYMWFKKNVGSYSYRKKKLI